MGRRENVCSALQVVALSGMTTSALRTPPSSPRQPVTSSRLRRLLRRALITSPRPRLAARWSRAGTAPPTTPASPSLLPASPASPSRTSLTPTWSKEASDLRAHARTHARTHARNTRAWCPVGGPAYQRANANTRTPYTCLCPLLVVNRDLYLCFPFAQFPISSYRL